VERVALVSSEATGLTVWDPGVGHLQLYQSKISCTKKKLVTFRTRRREIVSLLNLLYFPACGSVYGAVSKHSGKVQRDLILLTGADLMRPLELADNNFC
jgi:hypothetical protein